MISLIGALRKLGKKITGKELDNKTLTAVVNEMAEEYNGASTDYVDNKIGERITSVYKFKGNVEDFAHLPSTKNKVGDTYNLLDSGMNYAWNGSKWDALGGSYVLTVTDIQNITSEQCENLKCGDTVVKLTGEQKHAYTVTFKKADEGMCLTYVDASVAETVNYDLVEGVWTYNSTDVTELGGGGGSTAQYDMYLYEQQITFTYEGEDGSGKFSFLIAAPKGTILDSHNILNYIRSTHFDGDCGSFGMLQLYCIEYSGGPTGWTGGGATLLITAVHQVGPVVNLTLPENYIQNLIKLN